MTSPKLENIYRRHSSIDVAMHEAELRKDGAKAKANFTRSRNTLLLLAQFQDLQNHRGVLDACLNMDTCMENAMGVLSKCASFYIDNKLLQEGICIVREMEKIETDFYAAYEIAWAYLDSRFSSNQTVNKVGNLDQMHTSESIPRTVNCISPHPSGQAIQTKIHTRIKPGCEPVEHSTTKHCDTAEQYRPQNNDNRKSPNQNIAHCVTDSCATPSIGHDLWMQLERVKIPIFSGDKRNYPRWKAAFQACIDNAPVTPEYKMLQLRQYVSGEALKVIENLGHSSFAYEAAKDRLERKYGGKRRKVAIFLEDLERFKQIRSDSAEELEQFADLLDLAVINLKEAGEH